MYDTACCLTPGITDFEAGSLQFHGQLLFGTFAHWCMDWDDLPIDETCPEWPCACEWED